MVSDEDRAYMRRLAAAKAATHDEAVAEHLRLTPLERLRRSSALSAAQIGHANLAGRQDDPGAFYARARLLGLCDS